MVNKPFSKYHTNLHGNHMGFLSNAKWVAFSQIFKIGVQLLNIVVLARLIPPSEYGLMAMATVVTNFALLVRDLGTAAAIIQRKDLQHRTINAIFWLNVFMGLSIAIIIVVLSHIISIVFHEPRLILILCLLSINFPLASTASAHMALLERESKFKRVAFIEITSSIVAVAIAIVMAYYNYGVYSLVSQSIILSCMSTIQLWRASSWRPDYRKFFDWAEIKGLIGYSGNLTIFNFINYFSRNADSILIGHYFSASILGAYSLAYRVMLFPLQSLTFVASRALFPLLSQRQGNIDEFKKTYLQTIYFILLFVFPLMVGLATLREPFVNLVFGRQWFLTSVLLIWLAPTAIIQSVLSTSGTVFMAKGRTDILMRLGVFGTILMLLSFTIGVHYGIEQFTKFYFVANLINFFPVMILVMRFIDGTMMELFKKIFEIIISSFAMMFFILAIRRYFIYFKNIDNFFVLTVIVFLAILFYFIVITAFNPVNVINGIKSLKMRK